MNFDSIKTISDVETSADELRENAAVEAKTIVATARTMGEAKIKDARDQAQAKVKDLLAEAEEKGKKAAQEVEEAGKAEFSGLDNLVSTKMEQAISFIVERIENN